MCQLWLRISSPQCDPILTLWREAGSLMTSGLWPHLSPSHTAARPPDTVRVHLTPEIYDASLRLFVSWEWFVAYLVLIYVFMYIQPEFNFTNNWLLKNYFLFEKSQWKNRKAFNRNRNFWDWLVRGCSTQSQPQSSHESVRIRTCPRA